MLSRALIFHNPPLPTPALLAAGGGTIVAAVTAEEEGTSMIDCCLLFILLSSCVCVCGVCCVFVLFSFLSGNKVEF